MDIQQYVLGKFVFIRQTPELNDFQKLLGNINWVLPSLDITSVFADI